MTEYTTEIIDDLRGCERALKAFETDDEEVVIDYRARIGAYAGIGFPLVIKKNTSFAKGFISLLKSEVFRLKRELKQNLKIADVLHYEE